MAAPQIASKRATLSVVVKADDVVVAQEIVDQKVWQQVLNAITMGQAIQQPLSAPAPVATPPEEGSINGSTATNDEKVNALAQRLKISAEELEAACCPSSEPPYLTLDHPYWEELANQLQGRGTGAAFSPIVAPATLLALWFKVS